jgi:hypothetical protein
MEYARPFSRFFFVFSLDFTVPFPGVLHAASVIVQFVVLLLALLALYLLAQQDEDHFSDRVIAPLVERGFEQNVPGPEHIMLDDDEEEVAIESFLRENEDVDECDVEARSRHRVTMDLEAAADMRRAALRDSETLSRMSTSQTVDLRGIQPRRKSDFVHARDESHPCHLSSLGLNSQQVCGAEASAGGDQDPRSVLPPLAPRVASPFLVQILAAQPVATEPHIGTGSLNGTVRGLFTQQVLLDEMARQAGNAREAREPVHSLSSSSTNAGLDMREDIGGFDAAVGSEPDAFASYVFARADVDEYLQRCKLKDQQIADVAQATKHTSTRTTTRPERAPGSDEIEPLSAPMPANARRAKSAIEYGSSECDPDIAAMRDEYEVRQHGCTVYHLWLENDEHARQAAALANRQTRHHTESLTSEANASLEVQHSADALPPSHRQDATEGEAAPPKDESDPHAFTVSGAAGRPACLDETLHYGMAPHASAALACAMELTAAAFFADFLSLRVAADSSKARGSNPAAPSLDDRRIIDPVRATDRRWELARRAYRRSSCRATLARAAALVDLRFDDYEQKVFELVTRRRLDSVRANDICGCAQEFRHVLEFLQKFKYALAAVPAAVTALAQRIAESAKARSETLLAARLRDAALRDPDATTFVLALHHHLQIPIPPSMATTAKSHARGGGAESAVLLQDLHRYSSECIAEASKARSRSADAARAHLRCALALRTHSGIVIDPTSAEAIKNSITSQCRHLATLLFPHISRCGIRMKTTDPQDLAVLQCALAMPSGASYAHLEESDGNEPLGVDDAAQLPKPNDVAGQLAFLSAFAADLNEASLPSSREPSVITTMLRAVTGNSLLGGGVTNVNLSGVDLRGSAVGLLDSIDAFHVLSHVNCAIEQHVTLRARYVRRIVDRISDHSASLQRCRLFRCRVNVIRDNGCLRPQLSILQSPSPTVVEYRAFVERLVLCALEPVRVTDFMRLTQRSRGSTNVPLSTLSTQSSIVSRLARHDAAPHASFNQPFAPLEPTVGYVNVTVNAARIRCPDHGGRLIAGLEQYHFCRPAPSVDQLRDARRYLCALSSSVVYRAFCLAEHPSSSAGTGTHHPISRAPDANPSALDEVVMGPSGTTRATDARASVPLGVMLASGHREPFLVCPAENCSYAVRTSVAKLNRTEYTFARVGQFIYLLRRAGALSYTGLVALMVVQFLYLPGVRSAFAVATCHITTVCDYRACYGNGDSLIVAYFSGLVLIVVTLALTPFLTELVIVRKLRLLSSGLFSRDCFDIVQSQKRATLFQRDATEDRSASCLGALSAPPQTIAFVTDEANAVESLKSDPCFGRDKYWFPGQSTSTRRPVTVFQQVAAHVPSVAWHRVLLACDDSFFKTLYAPYRAMFAAVHPIFFVWQVLVVVFVLFIGERGSLAQLAAVAVLESVFAVLVTIARPFVDPPLNILASLTAAHQVLVLAMNGFHRSQAYNRDVVTPPGEPVDAPVAVMITATSFLLLALTITLIYAVAIPTLRWRAAVCKRRKAKTDIRNRQSASQRLSSVEVEPDPTPGGNPSASRESFISMVEVKGVSATSVASELLTGLRNRGPRRGSPFEDELPNELSIALMASEFAMLRSTDPLPRPECYSRETTPSEFTDLFSVEDDLPPPTHVPSVQYRTTVTREQQIAEGDEQRAATSKPYNFGLKRKPTTAVVSASPHRDSVITDEEPHGKSKVDEPDDDQDEAQASDRPRLE